MCNKCQNTRDREAELTKRAVPAIDSVDDAKRFLAAGHPNTAAEWLIVEVARLTAALQQIASANVAERSIAGTMRRPALHALGHPHTLCETCGKANVSCPIYPQETQTCVEYVAEAVRP